MRENLTPHRSLVLALLLTGLITGLLGCGTAGTEQDGTDATSTEGIQATSSEDISTPRVTDDASSPTGQRTQWSCVTFGSYPQTEIVREAFDAVDAYAIDEDEVVVDPSLFDALEEATWTDDECEVGGERYRRINATDTSFWAPDEAQHYRWPDKDAWHYFRYDAIVWRVGSLDGTDALLIADKLLDCAPYNEDARPVTWQTSTLRSWLNGLGASENACGIDYAGKGFVDTAFSNQERSAITARTVTNEPNGHYHTSSGPDTEDRVFLLSNDEVFASERATELGFHVGTGVDDPARRFRSTLFAKCRGAWWSPVEGYRGNSFWLMRTAGYTPESVSYICDFGYVYQRGTEITCADAGILPALWCDLATADLKPAGTVSSTDVIERAAKGASETEDASCPKVGNPEVTPDENEPDGKRVSYSMLTFGSYPQTEIVEDEADVALPDTAEVDAALVTTLAAADWSDDETTFDDQRYLRALAGDGGVRYFRIEPIYWRVLEVGDDVALLAADRALDCAPFNETMVGVTWEASTLRSYLNGYGAKDNAAGIDYTAGNASFLDCAFTPEEQRAILRWPTRNINNHYFGTVCGPDTADSVFLLAESEVFGQDSAELHGFARSDAVADRSRKLKATGYARYKGVWTSDADETAGNVAWMLRTSGYTPENVVYVDEGGYLYNRGMPVTCPDLAVVPAIRIDLSHL